jgi:hypothetical protein
VLKRVLGGKFTGHLVSDFYCGYNEYAGKHQRCWTHLLRDLHELKQAHEKETDVQSWAQSVRALYAQASEWLHEQQEPSQEQRERLYVELTSQTHRLGLEYAKARKHPCCALSKRLLRHEDELF